MRGFPEVSKASFPTLTSGEVGERERGGRVEEEAGEEGEGHLG
jgi:hypothetical protein